MIGAYGRLLNAGDQESPERGRLRLMRERPGFGTAGIRGRRGDGPGEINLGVIRDAVAGVAEVLRTRIPAAATRGVVVGYDARHESDRFAAEAVSIVVSAGLRAIALAGPAPTPIVAYAARTLGTAAAITLTASHNPPEDSGLKVYWDDACHIIPPIDREIEAAIDRLAPVPVPPVARGDDPPVDLVDRYVAAALRLVAPRPAASIRIATSAMHGVGGGLLARLLAEAGHRDVHPVPEQERPDPDFPTVRLPNPEEPGATDRLQALCRAVAVDVGVALDPDADRVAVIVGGRQLTGDEVGALLTWWLLRPAVRPARPLVASTIVSSQLAGRIASAAGAHYEETLTGFKWLCRPARAHPELTQVLAYEEAIGYAVGPDSRDKDGLTAALVVCDLVAALKADGRTLTSVLDELATQFGRHVTGNFAVRYAGDDWQERREAALTALVEDPPASLGGLAVDLFDLPAPDVLRLRLAGGGRAIARPSGTEPRLKCYVEVVDEVDPDGRLAAIRRDLETLLDA